MEKCYIEPVCEIIELENVDIVTDSDPLTKYYGSNEVKYAVKWDS